jgi:hypothetical protein
LTADGDDVVNPVLGAIEGLPGPELPSIVDLLAAWKEIAAERLHLLHVRGWNGGNDLVVDVVGRTGGHVAEVLVVCVVAVEVAVNEDVGARKAIDVSSVGDKEGMTWASLPWRCPDGNLVDLIFASAVRRKGGSTDAAVDTDIGVEEGVISVGLKVQVLNRRWSGQRRRRPSTNANNRLKVRERNASAVHTVDRARVRREGRDVDALIGIPYSGTELGLRRRLTSFNS